MYTMCTMARIVQVELVFLMMRSATAKMGTSATQVTVRVRPMRRDDPPRDEMYTKRKVEINPNAEPRTETDVKNRRLRGELISCQSDASRS